MALVYWKMRQRYPWTHASMFGYAVLFLILHTSVQVLSQAAPPEYAFNNRVLEKSASCDRNFIYFSIVFARPFLGLIYTDGSFGSPRCTYVNGSVFSQIRYNITIPLNECRSQTFANGSSQNVVVVQRDWRILEASDNLFVITCNNPATGGGGSSSGFNAGGGGKFTLSFAGVTVQGTLASTEIVTSSFSDVDYTAEVVFGPGPTGRRLDRALGVGEQISYVVRLKKLRAGQIDARIGRCWATDGLPSSISAPNTEIQLSDDDGCTVLPGSNIWNNFRTAPLSDGGEDGKILYNDIKAWAFPTSSRVNIFCNLHLCPSTCPPAPCRLRDEQVSTFVPTLAVFTSPPPNNGTKKPKSKRTADGVLVGVGSEIDDEEMVARISTSYEIFPDRRVRDQPAVQRDSLLVTAGMRNFHQNPEYSSTRDQDESAAVKTVCLTHTNFVVGVSLLLIIITLSFVFIIALLCKMSRRGRAKRRLYGERIRRLFTNRSSTSSFGGRSDRRGHVGASDGDSESAATSSTIGRSAR